MRPPRILKRAFIRILLCALLVVMMPDLQQVHSEQQPSLPCPFQGEYQSCQCERMTVDSVKVFCKHRNWIPNVPSVPNSTNTRLRISSLTIVSSNVVLLKGDTFNGQDIQLLDLSYNQINYINLQAFRGLKHKLYQLSLNHNLLTSIPTMPLAGLNRLQYLYLQNNRINHIDSMLFRGTQLGNIRFLHLDNNLISSVPHGAFMSLPELQVLTLSNNRITIIENDVFPPTLWLLKLSNNALDRIPLESVAGLRSLQTLDLAGNNISTILSYPQLRFDRDLNLDLSGNRIAVLRDGAFSNFVRLRSLDLSYNELEVVRAAAFMGVEQLETLKLSFNRITHVEQDLFQKLSSSVKRLELEENRLPSVPMTLYYLHQLEYLNLKSNRIATLEPHVFANFKHSLTELLLSYNQLERIPTATLEGMNKLLGLDLSRNKIKELAKLAFGKFSEAGNNLVRLNLAGNQIRRIEEPEAFIYMSGVVYLDLSHNQIDTIGAHAFQLLSGLETLFLQNNRLSQVPSSAMQGLKKLRNLNLDQNQVQALLPESLKQLVQLQSLSLANNRLHAIYTHTFPSSMDQLRLLNLMNNQIVYVARHAFHNLSSLRQVNLQNNLLYCCHGEAFLSLPQLERILLDRNEINETQPRMIVDLPRLKVLGLSHNRLRHILQNAIVDAPVLEELDLSYNQFSTINKEFMKEANNLKKLNLACNNLTEVELKQFKQSLELLNLRGNRLQKIGPRMFADFQMLKRLDLSDNSISELSPYSFSNSPSLKEGIFSRNKMEAIGKSTFSKQTLWKLLDLSANRIEFLEDGAFGQNNVEALDLSDNRLGEVPHSAINSISDSLKSLVLAHNHIEDLEADLDSFPALRVLEHLDLSHNNIQKLSDASFSGITHLQRLDLSGNPIKSMSKATYKNISFYLESLNLSNMNLRSIPELGQTGLMFLNLSNNLIFDIAADDLRAVKKIEVLDLSHNQIARISGDALSSLLNLKVLNLSHNPIRYLEADAFRNLHKLESLWLHDLSLEHFEEAAFDRLRNLKELKFYGFRQLQAVNVSNLLKHLPPLRALHIELVNELVLGNQLLQLDSRLLKLVHINGQQLREVSIGAFINLRGYNVQLSITNTSISELPLQMFEAFRCVSFLSLDLSDNRIRTLNPFRYSRLPAISTQGTVLLDINLQNNPLHCGCELLWVRDWLAYLKLTLTSEDFEARMLRIWKRTFCASPSHLKGAPLSELDFSTVTCSTSSAAPGIAPAVPTAFALLVSYWLIYCIAVILTCDWFLNSLSKLVLLNSIV